jgi:GAF domain-containing protein
MSTKAATYQTAVKQIESFLQEETDSIANLANIAAVLHASFGFWWTGFYFVKNNELVLGPFQGPVACTRIGFGKGVCGTAWKEKQTIVVPDVHQFPGHIACSAASNSEIVVPVMVDGEVIMVLDIDSTEYGCFDEIDKQYLEEIAILIAQKIPALA